MDWGNKSWEVEDAQFAPKRRVNNRGSRHKPHIIGSFYSPKTTKVVEYESLAEYLFYALLELDKSALRYYVQPVEVDIPYIDGDTHRSWTHVPDVLVFRQGSVPILYQIKDTSVDEAHLQHINFACVNFANQREWNYKIVYPKTMPSVVARNVKFLMGHLVERHGFEDYIPEVISRLAILRAVSIRDLAESFSYRAHPLYVLPVIYHLIAIGAISTNVNEVIDDLSEVSLMSLTDFGTISHD
ncbi:TnsA endonuclease C-terminal domain-containing protein [Alicyclobacillus dauci]|uniref:TnsA endonuclease C-terminal domain-containing protein n=1 Tax=Alicyclobacillus dauci TaxID=1475485 RepID=A0ABY6Z3H9_9BACL|nr:TnsA endonuclease C-terminal domain-containing protein [Alicyclobacillus dauci]WAH37433.1 TnsA endonuclease C-terminal domain-containing protein [Alicyclobacillus dauci]